MLLRSCTFPHCSKEAVLYVPSFDCNVNSRCHTIRADAAGLEEAVLITLKKQLEILLPAHEDGTLHLDATAAKCSEYEKQLED